MYNTILLAAALQEWKRYSAHALAAREMAAALARGTSRCVHVLSAYEYELIQGIEAPISIINKRRREQRHQTELIMQGIVDAYIAPLQDEGLRVETILRVGTPWDVIVDVATSIGADLLIMGSHSKRGLFDIALGGTAQHVSKRAPCQVVMVSPAPRAKSPSPDAMG
ncbi:MAG: universal stress protein [Thiohalocapsa sp.]